MKIRVRATTLTAILLLFSALLTFVSLMPIESNMAAAAAKPVTTKNIDTLDEALKTGWPVILKLGSDKCRPCLAMNPIMKELAAEQDGKAVFLALDVYQNRELAGKYGVRLIPTVIFFDKQGKPKAKKEGFMNKRQLLKEIADLGLNK